VHSIHGTGAIREPLERRVAEDHVELVVEIQILRGHPRELDSRVRIRRLRDHPGRDVRAGHAPVGDVNQLPGYVTRPAPDVKHRLMRTDLQQPDELSSGARLHE
jgi:hypothetical protein